MKSTWRGRAAGTAAGRPQKTLFLAGKLTFAAHHHKMALFESGLRMNAMSRKRSLVSLSVLALVLIAAAGLPAVDLAQLQKSYDQAMKAYNEKNYPGYLEGIAESLRHFPNHPLLLYRLAAAYALNGMPLKGMPFLRPAASMGLV